jgi:hypothetical protein
MGKIQVDENFLCGYYVGMKRPRNLRSESRTNILRIRLTAAERKELDALAAAQTLDTSTWARMVLLLTSKRKS